jgi:hypothetical protein
MPRTVNASLNKQFLRRVFELPAVRFHDRLQGEIMGEGELMGPVNYRVREHMLRKHSDIKYETKWTMLAEYLRYLEARCFVQCGFLHWRVEDSRIRDWVPRQTADAPAPDARSKSHVIRLSAGRFVLASNLAQNSRIPLALSVSDDGIVFGRMTVLRKQATTPSYPPPGITGYPYPRMVEYDRYLICM